MLTAILLAPWPRETITIVLLSGAAVVLATMVALVVMNARLVTHLRQKHVQLYESIGAPGIWWNKSANQSAVMWFVLGSRWANVNDPDLIRLCWKFRTLVVLHFGMCAVVLLILLTDMVKWIVS